MFESVELQVRWPMSIFETAYGDPDSLRDLGSRVTAPRQLPLSWTTTRCGQWACFVSHPRNPRRHPE